MAQPREYPTDVSHEAAIYMRVSSPGQEENYSLSTQEEESRKYCDMHGYHVAEEHVYRDGAQKSYTLDRPGLDALRAEIRAGRIGVVVALKLDRLSRDTTQQGVLLYEAERYGARLEFVKDRIDDTLEGRIMRASLGIVAEVERHNIRERTQRGRRARARSGKLIPGAFPLYGYLWEDDTKSRYVVDPETAPVVQRIYRETAAGTSVMRLCQALTAEGIPTPMQVLRQRGYFPPSNKPVVWGKSTIGNILRTPTYGGHAIAYRTKNGYRKERELDSGLVRDVRVQVVRHEDDEDRVELPPDVCPPLVDAQTVAAVRERLARNKAEARRHNLNAEAALLRGGYVVCGYCGSPMHAFQASGGRAVMYMCGRRRNGFSTTCRAVTITARIADELVWEHVTRVMLDPNHLERALAKWRRSSKRREDGARAHLESVEGRIAQKQEERSNLMATSAITADSDSRKALAALIDAASDDLRKLQKERAKAMEEAAVRAGRVQHVEDLVAWARTWQGRLPTFSYEQKRITLYALDVQMQVWGTDHEPRYHITPEFIDADDEQATGEAPVPTPAHVHSDHANFRA